jgi:hypothetical protein
MAKTVKKETKEKEKDPNLELKILKTKKQYRMLFGFVLVLMSIAFLVSFISFFLHGQADQSAVNALTDRDEPVKNWLGKFGAYLADLFIYRGFGIASFLFVKLFFLSGAFLVLDLPVVAGQTYYIVISTNGNPNTIPYTLSIQVVNCAPPTNLGAVGGQTSAILNWNANGATSWEYAVQLIGGVIPTGAGVQTNAFQNVNVTNLLDGTPIQAATQYQYWVRRDCGDGTFSAWAGPFLFNTTICEPTSQCNYTFVLRDSFGDGWNGATMQVRQNGIVVATLGTTFTTGGGPINVTVPLCNGLPFDLFWNAGGTFAGEVRVQIINPFNQTLYNMTTASAGLVNSVLYAGTVDCLNPACLPPSGVTVTNIGGTTAQVGWTAIPGITQYEVIVLPTGSPAPTASS